MPSLTPILTSLLLLLLPSHRHQALAAASAATTDSSSELRRLVTLSRHGSRAPNAATKTLCPNNRPNIESYNVPVEQLTEFGMQQLVAVGEHIRKVYVDDAQFLSPTLNGVRHAHFESYFRSDAATRCSQSATALGYGLYPDGTGPKGFPRQPVPVTMELLPNEHDFAAPKGPCKQTLVADMVQYAKGRAVELLDEYKDVIDQVGELCGVNLWASASLEGGEDLLSAIRDVADMFIFDRQQGLPPLRGLTPELSSRLEQLAFRLLMEKYFAHERTVTYWTGGFATVLQRSLAPPGVGGGAGAGAGDAPKYLSYHGHRGLLHALGKMLGWTFQFDGLPEALNMTSLHPGTTMFFELRARNTSSDGKGGETYFVRTFNWSPQTPREQVTLTKCSSADCPLDEFNAIIANHITRTGTWQAICGYHCAKGDPEATAGVVESSVRQSSGGGDRLRIARSQPTTMALGVTAGILLGLALSWHRRHHRHPHPYERIRGGQ